MQALDERGPRALFLSPGGQALTDDRVCSGLEATSLAGKACPHADCGRMPRPRAIDARTARRWPERGQAGDLAPPCSVVQLGSLGEWLGGRPGGYPERWMGLRLFRCRQWFMLIVPGLHDGAPDRLSESGTQGPTLAG